MTDLHMKLLKRYRIDQTAYEAWVKQALKKRSPHKPLFTKLDAALYNQEKLDAALEYWTVRHYTQKGYKSDRKQVWGARCQRVAQQIEDRMIDIMKACRHDLAQGAHSGSEVIKRRASKHLKRSSSPHQ